MINTAEDLNGNSANEDYREERTYPQSVEGGLRLRKGVRVDATDIKDYSVAQSKHRLSDWKGEISSCAGLLSYQDQSVNFLVKKIDGIISKYGDMPVSYNQVMLRGSLRYYAKLLTNIDSYEDRDLIKKIKRLVDQCDGLLLQFEDTKLTFSGMDLTYIENEFESIEAEASKGGFLPKLEDMAI